MANQKLLSMIGMSKKAGKAIVGVPMICEHISKKKNLSPDEFLIIEASDTSENTHKKILNKCEFYKIRHIQIDSTCCELGAALGKSATAAVAITGKDMCCAVFRKMPE